MKDLVYGRNRQEQKKSEEYFFRKGKSGGRQNSEYPNKSFFSFGLSIFGVHSFDYGGFLPYKNLLIFHHMYGTPVFTAYKTRRRAESYHLSFLYRIVPKTLDMEVGK
jgi:hypothetical protein